MQNVVIADVTLKETQKNSSSLSFKERIEIAKYLDRLGVCVVELPAIADEKLDSILIKSICSTVKNSIVSVVCPLNENGIETAWQAISKAQKPRLQLVVPVSTVQMEFICCKKPHVVLEMISALVAKAKSLCADVEFVAQDATRSEKDFLFKAVAAAIEAGANLVTFSDDAGIMTPQEFSSFVETIKENVPTVADVSLGVQCSNEYSMASSCAVAAVQAGVSEIKTSVCGTSTVSLETISQFIRARGEELGILCPIKFNKLQRSAKQIDWIIHSKRSKSSPFENGVQNYSTDFAIGEHETFEQVISAIKTLGYDLSDDDNAKVYEEFKRISGKKPVTAKDLDAIVASSALQVPTTYFLESYVINSGNVISATANITLRKNDEKLSGLCGGDGPIDASFLAIEQIVGHHFELDDFQIQAVTEGREAMGSALVRLRSKGKLYSGKGISTDIIGASIRAYLNALNKIVFEEA